jgi:hypothetical protein
MRPQGSLHDDPFVFLVRVRYPRSTANFVVSEWLADRAVRRWLVSGVERSCAWGDIPGKFWPSLATVTRIDVLPLRPSGGAL